jgi:ATP-binding cassette subfamily B protein
MSSSASASASTLPIARTPLRFLGGLLWRRFRWRTLGLVLLAAAGIGLMGFEPVLIKRLLDGLAAGGPDAQVWGVFWLMVAAWFGSAAANRLREWLDLHTAPQLRLEAQAEVYRWLDRHAPAFFHDELAGSLSQKVKQTGTSCVTLLSIVSNGFVRVAVAILISALVLADAPGHFFWTFIVWLVAFLAAGMWFARRCVPLFKAFGEEVSASTGVLVDVNAHMDVVQAHAMRERERGRIAQALGRERTASMNTRRFLVKMMIVMYSALLAFQCAFIGLAVDAQRGGAMTVGDVAMVVSLATILVNNVWGLFDQLVQYFENVGVLQSALGVITRPHAIVEVPGAPALAVRAGEIRFEQVGYRTRDGQPLFEGLELTIQAGERVGLVGPSGAGKSTLTRLIRRHQDLHAGRILIDGQDVARVTLDSLNAAVADVPQDPALFHRSLRDNIAYAQPDADEAAVMRAAAAAHCDAFIARRGQGLEVLVGERGIRLSGGERQRVALARAFLKDAPILILDEATSALDSETEALIQDAIEELCRGRTVIAIAHRLSTLARMDRILVMDNGRIVEQGTHEQLLALGGVYARLWARQSAGFLAG